MKANRTVVYFLSITQKRLLFLVELRACPHPSHARIRNLALHATPVNFNLSGVDEIFFGRDENTIMAWCVCPASWAALFCPPLAFWVVLLRFFLSSSGWCFFFLQEAGPRHPKGRGHAAPPSSPSEKNEQIHKS